MIEAVDALLGSRVMINQRTEGDVDKASVAVYETASQRVEAEFVEGVSVWFAVNSR